VGGLLSVDLDGLSRRLLRGSARGLVLDRSQVVGCRSGRLMVHRGGVGVSRGSMSRGVRGGVSSGMSGNVGLADMHRCVNWGSVGRAVGSAVGCAVGSAVDRAVGRGSMSGSVHWCCVVSGGCLVDRSHMSRGNMGGGDNVGSADMRMRMSSGVVSRSNLVVSCSRSVRSSVSGGLVMSSDQVLRRGSLMDDGGSNMGVVVSNRVVDRLDSAVAVGQGLEVQVTVLVVAVEGLVVELVVLGLTAVAVDHRVVVLGAVIRLSDRLVVRCVVCGPAVH